MLRYRLASAIVLIPLIIVSAIYGGLLLFATSSVALLLAEFEFLRMAQHAGYRTNIVLGLVLAGLFLLDAFLKTAWPREILAAVLVLSLVAAVLRPQEGWVAGWALTLAGALYIGVLGSYFLYMNNLPNGVLWTVIVLLATWGNDTGAFIAGTSFGRHGFFTNISPKKTWEGAVGGLFVAVIAVLVLGGLVGLPPVHGLLMGLAVGVAGIFGDLAESVIKRQFSAKDSGAIVPGHGGMLDRVDSLLFAAVVAYYYLVWVVHVV